MIISVEELKEFITTTEKDKVLEAKLQALELLIRSHTHNRFLKKPYVRVNADVVAGVFTTHDTIPFKVGDTVQVSVGDNATDCGLYTVKEIVDDETFTVNEDTDDFIKNVSVSLVQYKADVKMGVIEILDWKLKNGDKVGIQSETISRHSQTFDRASIDADFGVPKDLLGFLKPYVKARF